MMNGITTCIPASFDDRQAAVPRLHFVRLCPRYAANALGDLGAQAARATGLCPRMTAPVRLWPPELAKASSALGGSRALFVRRWPARSRWEVVWYGAVPTVRRELPDLFVRKAVWRNDL